LKFPVSDSRFGVNHERMRVDYGFSVQGLEFGNLLIFSLSRKACSDRALVGKPAGTSTRPWLVANQATLTQKWPPPPRNVADSCELTEMTKAMQPPISVDECVRARTGHLLIFSILRKACSARAPVGKSC